MKSDVVGEGEVGGKLEAERPRAGQESGPRQAPLFRRRVLPDRLSWVARRKKDVATYLEKGWPLVPVDRETGEVGEASRDLATVLGWTEDLKVDIGVVTGRDSGIVALRFAHAIGRPISSNIPGHPPLPATLEVNGAFGLGGKYLLFHGPQEDLPCREIADRIKFFGEGGVITPIGATRGEIAPFPESLLPLILGEASVDREEKVIAGGLPATAKSVVAAQAYFALGFNLVPVDSNGNRFGKQDCSFTPKAWEKEPSVGVGVRTGFDFGVAALRFANQAIFQKFKEKHGQFCSSVIQGRHPIVCLRAPEEGFVSQEITDQIRYIGENDFFPAPPSQIDGLELEWVAGGLSPQDLPELLPTLRALLAKRQSADATRRSRSKSASKARGRGQATHVREPNRAVSQRASAVCPEKTRGAAPAAKSASKAATTEEWAKLLDAWLARALREGK